MDAHFNACSTLHKHFYFMLPIELLYIFLTILYMCFGAEDTNRCKFVNKNIFPVLYSYAVVIHAECSLASSHFPEKKTLSWWQMLVYLSVLKVPSQLCTLSTMCSSAFLYHHRWWHLNWLQAGYSLSSLARRTVSLISKSSFKFW